MHSHNSDERTREASTASVASQQPAKLPAVSVGNDGKIRPLRFENALRIIDPGACNPSGIAFAIAEACREARDEGLSTKDDPAVRLMVTQLAWVCRADSDTDEYAKLVAECRTKAVGN